MEEEKSVKKKRSGLLKIIGNVLFWVIIVVLFATWITDFVKTRNSEKPIFCVKRIEHKFDDGTVDECVGLGYKVYTYHRDSIKIKSQFSPFFIGMEKQEVKNG